MRAREIACAVIGALVVLGVGVVGRAQEMRAPLGPFASVAPGSIVGVVQDERGLSVEGAVVSAVGSTSAVSISDRRGYFEFHQLSPGPYLVRAHLTGFAAPRGRIVEVRPSLRASSSIALRRLASTDSEPPVLAAAVGTTASEGPSSVETPTELASPPSGATAVDGEAAGDDHGEVAWRLRRLRRGVLRDVVFRGGATGNDPLAPGGALGPARLFGRAAESSAHFASTLFNTTPVSGRFDLLTTSSFDAPEELFSVGGLGRSSANLSLRAPVAGNADWSVRGALTQGDVSSWVVAAAYTTRESSRHRYDIGLSYATQQYGTGSPAILRDGTSGSRSASDVYAFDTYALSPLIALTYGARLSNYGYVADPSAVSPRVAVSLTPAEGLRIKASLSRRASAPGAEEFVPPPDGAVWIPPQRTFASLVQGVALRGEQTSHMEVDLARDFGAATVSVRGFRQAVADQNVTLFGVDLPGVPTRHLGHYLVANAGDVDTMGWSAGIGTSAAQRLRGSIEYSQAQGRWNRAGSDFAYILLVTPSAARRGSERVQGVTTRIETEVPETSTRILLMYRVNDAFAQGENREGGSRFDVQVRQSLPFMDFSTARWEMLVAVRNVFHEAALDSSVYDELLVVRPPKRIVGGLTLRF